MEQETQTTHKRRVHYKGKYPKKFEEKYKELQPEKYGDTIAHVIEKGNTPAGMHISIMVKEILDFLQIKPGEIGFDATLGYGGHTKAMLERRMLTRRNPQRRKNDWRTWALAKRYLPFVCKTSARSMRSQRKSAALILFWRISACLPCRSTIRSAVFRLKWTDRWICV